MLVLSRKKDEKIIIDDEIKITVIDISGDKVQLGIEAPDNIDIHREEVYRKIEQENIEATQSKLNLDELKEINIDEKDKE